MPAMAPPTSVSRWYALSSSLGPPAHHRKWFHRHGLNRLSESRIAQCLLKLLHRNSHLLDLFQHQNHRNSETASVEHFVVRFCRQLCIVVSVGRMVSECRLLLPTSPRLLNFHQKGRLRKVRLRFLHHVVQRALSSLSPPDSLCTTISSPFFGNMNSPAICWHSHFGRRKYQHERLEFPLKVGQGCLPSRLARVTAVSRKECRVKGCN